MKQSLSQLYHIRTYQPGDEVGQVAVYNEATRAFPGYKLATVDEVLRRYRSLEFDPLSKLYAVRNGRMVAYVSFSSNGRVSAPWCLPDAADAGSLLMEAAVNSMRQRGLNRAWAAYRADWTEIRRLLESFHFAQTIEIFNFIADIAKLPANADCAPFTIRKLDRNDIREAYNLDPTAFAVTSHEALAEAWLNGPYISADSFFVLQDANNRSAGVGLAIVNPQYADPSKIDSAMPCFRLGAVRTELERTKRVNGLFSYFSGSGDESVILRLLAEACRRFHAAGIAHVAAQCPSDRTNELAFYRKYFEPQKSFPILVREL